MVLRGRLPTCIHPRRMGYQNGPTVPSIIVMVQPLLPFPSPTPSDPICLPSDSSAPTPKHTHITMLHPLLDQPQANAGPAQIWFPCQGVPFRIPCIICLIFLHW